MENGKFNVLFFSCGPPDSSSTVHRCKAMGKTLKKRYNIDYEIISEREKKRSQGQQIFPTFRNYLKACIINYDVLIIHRSATFITYYLLKVTKSKNIPVIFDYDDALFETKSMAYTHLNKIIKESDVVTAGSHYLLEYSKNINKNSFLLPTPVDTELFHPKKREHKENDYIIIGWLGAGTELQLPYLRILKRPLKILSQKYDVKFKIVSALSEKVRNEFKNLGFEVDFGLDHWVPIEKIPDLISDFDIGVMPLTDNPFSRGKCAMKALEYMAMEIPVVASAVGENKYVIKEGYNGFLASNEEEWIKSLETLILDERLREEMGKNGRKTVEEKYSLNVIGEKMYNIINNVVTI